MMKRLTRPIHTTTTLTSDEQATVREIMRELGIDRARLRLGIARHAMERAAMGATIQRGTAALIRLALGTICKSRKKTRREVPAWLSKTKRRYSSLTMTERIVLAVVVHMKKVHNEDIDPDDVRDAIRAWPRERTDRVGRVTKWFTSACQNRLVDLRLRIRQPPASL